MRICWYAEKWRKDEYCVYFFPAILQHHHYQHMLPLNNDKCRLRQKMSLSGRCWWEGILLLHCVFCCVISFISNVPLIVVLIVLMQCAVYIWCDTNGFFPLNKCIRLYVSLLIVFFTYDLHKKTISCFTIELK